jgi:hypothetical protein
VITATNCSTFAENWGTVFGRLGHAILTEPGRPASEGTLTIELIQVPLPTRHAKIRDASLDD